MITDFGERVADASWDGRRRIASVLPDVSLTEVPQENVRSLPVRERGQVFGVEDLEVVNGRPHALRLQKMRDLGTQMSPWIVVLWQCCGLAGHEACTEVDVVVFGVGNGWTSLHRVIND